jgi:hypothetical protein
LNSSSIVGGVADARPALAAIHDRQLRRAVG